MEPKKQTLIAISVESIQREPYISSDGNLLKSAVIMGISDEAEVSFEMKTGLLNPEQVRRCQLLQRHGFTVVEVPDNWKWKYNAPSLWQEEVIEAAMRRVAKRYDLGGEISVRGTYDSEFAEQVLIEINKYFPRAVQTSQIKHAFEDEPSDSELLTALAGLQRDGFIEGKTLFGSMSGLRELAAMANIEITAAGRKHLSGASAPSATPTIIHGDQFNNYGQAGAMGGHATGTLNYQSQWAALKKEMDLSTIAKELQNTIQELHRTAASSEDYKRLEMLAQAKEQADQKNGGKMLEVLSKIGQKALPIFTKCGAEALARLIEHHLT